ncbi:oligosaccharyltransferase alpha subunit [Rhizodiscina lignyota]|uniref:Dolichyl-diphosphooligosaccharide--protein glycosyltransferase subunit 1 n=1 Tax=Rhizodiscina lignyota TaxID=1504668 RepID=A0A9P4IP47_9PEZI|nr:oligosaccharyltransferase alpha subunit [Rhizodiscina lignyota]
MKSFFFGLSCIAALFNSIAAADSNLTKPLSSKQILPANFKPPQVFSISKLERHVNLEKVYPKQTWEATVKNVDKEPQTELYIPFESDVISRIGGFQAYEKGIKSKLYETDVVEYDTESSTEFYKITLREPLAPKAEKTLVVKYHILSALRPLPELIEQMSSQHVQHTLSAYAPSSYPVITQSTIITFPSSRITDYTVLPDSVEPSKSARKLTYGPYKDVPAGAEEPISVRYEFTFPLTHASLLERDIEVSHWGGNVAFEDRFWLSNRAAGLQDHFSRVKWQMAQYANPPTTALKDMRIPLRPGSADAYFTDDIGNVSTSRFRSNSREAELWLKPRYPLFGKWNYSFKIGWNGDAANFLRKSTSGDGYVLKVPFLEGPKLAEGLEYERVELRVILPEGSRNIKFDTTVPLVGNDTSIHRTFMDTLGRPTLSLTALNLVDELRDTELIVTYDYAWGSAYRKPITISVAAFAVFTAAWFIGSLDVSIGKKVQKA